MGRDHLAHLELDFPPGQRVGKVKSHLEFALGVLHEYMNLQVFSYHHHVQDTMFTRVMLKDTWNLPRLKTAAMSLKPRSWPRAHQMDGYWISETALEVVATSKHGRDQATWDPLGHDISLEIALLDHVQNLPRLFKVVMAETVYKRLLSDAPKFALPKMTMDSGPTTTETKAQKGEQLLVDALMIGGKWGAYIGDISAGTTIRTICNVVKGDMLSHIVRQPQAQSAVVCFVNPDAAALFVDYATTHKVQINSQLGKVY
ncbi:hypothetical protein BGX33_002760 [Mortierella sp. NVP41]|nr:hypothetical protein BGX33_002760 [Mortierella sp. NVP41]